MSENNNQEHEADIRFAERLSKRTNKVVKRPKASRRRTPGPKPASAPGGIRQRRNKRWSW